MSTPLEVHISIFDEAGHLHGAEEGIAAATVTPEFPACQCGPLLDTHRLRAVLPAGVPYGVPGWIHLEIPGYEVVHQRVTLAQDIGIQLVKQAPPVSRLRAAGQFFETETGARFTVIECSDFALYQRYLQAQNIEPILAQRQAIGFNMVRVFGMFNGSLGRFLPAEFGESYYALLPAFFQLLSRYGLYGEFTANADSRTVFSSATPQVDHWMTLGTIFPGIPNALVECVNENDQPINRLWTDLVRMRGVLSAHGSNGSQAAPLRPPWDYETVHLNGAFEWQRKTPHWPLECSAGAEGIAGSHVPVIANENTRYPDQDNSLAHAEDAAKAAALLCAGSCYHSVKGKASQLWDGVELQAGQTWAQAARAADLTYQAGAYVHRTDMEPPGVLRCYGRRLPSGAELDVQIRV